jgi:hypothetical protein
MKLTAAQAASILGVSADCTDEDVLKKAYRTLALKYHPDKAKDMSKEDAGEQRAFVSCDSPFSRLEHSLIVHFPCPPCLQRPNSKR